MSEKKVAKLSALFSGSDKSGQSGSPPDSPHRSDEEGTELLKPKRRSSISKIMPVKRRESKEEKKDEKPNDYIGLIEATEKKSKSHKKLTLASTYASKKQFLELQVETFHEMAEINKRLEIAEKQIVSLTSSLDRYEREHRRQITLAGEQQIEESGSSYSCLLMDWFL